MSPQVSLHPRVGRHPPQVLPSLLVLIVVSSWLNLTILIFCNQDSHRYIEELAIAIETLPNAAPLIA
jgi:hypothetical protein